MKVVSVFDLIERLEQFYNYNDFISLDELNCIFANCFDCSDNSIEI